MEWTVGNIDILQTPLTHLYNFYWSIFARQTMVIYCTITLIQTKEVVLVYNLLRVYLLHLVDRCAQIFRIIMLIHWIGLRVDGKMQETGGEGRCCSRTFFIYEIIKSVTPAPQVKNVCTIILHDYVTIF